MQEMRKHPRGNCEGERPTPRVLRKEDEPTSKLTPTWKYEQIRTIMLEVLSIYGNEVEFLKDGKAHTFLISDLDYEVEFTEQVVDWHNGEATLDYVERVEQIDEHNWNYEFTEVELCELAIKQGL